MADLFSTQLDPCPSRPKVMHLGQGIIHIKHLVPSGLFLHHIERITSCAPLRQMMTPMGHKTRVKMSNCGTYGWVSDLNGYRYSPIDPLSQRHWPHIPSEYLQIHKYACELASLPIFEPDACLINCYAVGDAMGRHQDKDEMYRDWPIISISLGLPCIFQVFGLKRNDPSTDILLEDGDVIVLSGASRHYYHGVKPIKIDPLNPHLSLRYNLTLRKSH